MAPECSSGARPTKHISFEFEIRWKFKTPLVWNIRGRSQLYFAHVKTVSLSWRVQNIVVIGRVYSKLERSDFSSNFEFDRNMLSGTGARWCCKMCEIRLSILNNISRSKYVTKHYWYPDKFWANMSKFIVITVSTNVLAPLGSMLIAGTAATKFVSNICETVPSRAKYWLQQLGHPHSENTPCCPMVTTVFILIGSQVKRRQSQSY